MDDPRNQDPRHFATGAATVLAAIRRESPLVQNITNTVATNFTANTLLAVGAAPAMVDIAEESGIFAEVASALLVNLGTLSHQQRNAARVAVTAAGQAGTPWVLDPVAIGTLPFRTEFAAELLQSGLSAVRGNASEIMALAGTGPGGRGVDSTAQSDSAADAATDLARAHHTIVAVSGEQDLITDGQSAVYVSGGHPMLTRITASGCALGSLVAAALGTEATGSFEAVVAAHLIYGVAAERAAEHATGPGTFVPALLDALATVTPEQVMTPDRLRIVRAATADGQA